MGGRRYHFNGGSLLAVYKTSTNYFLKVGKTPALPSVSRLSCLLLRKATKLGWGRGLSSKEEAILPPVYYSRLTHQHLLIYKQLYRN